MSAEAYGHIQPVRPDLRIVANHKHPEIYQAVPNTAILQGFDNYLSKELELSMQEISPRDVHSITAGAHDFVHGVVAAQHKKLTDAGQTPSFHPTPPGAVRDIYDKYFRDYGFARWVNGKRLADERKFIADNTAEIENKLFGGREIHSHPKYNRFPEISLSFELQRSLALTHNDLAADAVEVLRAAYGYRFRQIGGEALRASMSRPHLAHDYEAEPDRVPSSYDADEMWPR